MGKFYTLLGIKERISNSKPAIKLLLLIIIVILGVSNTSAQTNVALTATATHSGGGATTYGPQNYNDNIIPTDVNTFGWVSSNGSIEYTWAASQYIDEVRFFLGNRNMTSCTIQYWNGSAYVTCGSYSGSAGTGLITVTRTFTGVNTTRLRFISIAGSNPNFREIQVYPGCQTGCVNVAAETTPTLVAASACSNGTFRVGSGAYYNLTVAANTYYNFSWNNNGATNLSGFCATPQNGSASSFTTNQTGWFSGTTTTLRVSANRTSCNWVATSAIMTYRHTQPTAGTVTGTGANTTVCDGTTVGFTSGSSSNGTFSMFQYQWNITTGSWTNWGTTNPYNWASHDGSGTVLNVRAAINNNGCITYSPSVATTVSPATVGGAVSSNGTICSGSQPAANLTLSGHTGSVVRWEKATNTSFTGATSIAVTSTTLTPAQAGALTATTYFRAVVKSGVCGEVGSSYATITVNPTSVGGTVSSNGSICSGSQPAANLTLSGHTGSVVRWEKATNTAFTGATTIAVTSTTLTPAQAGALTATTYFRAVVKSGVCAEAASSYVTITVNPLPTAAVAGTNTICAGNGTTLTASGGSTYAWSTGATTAAITVSPAANTTYTVTATSAAGCTATASRTVTVNALPSAAISGTASVCAGNGTTLTASGGSTYAWSTGATTAAITVSPAANTTYTVTATSAAGCTATASRTVTVNALPSAAISGTASICAGNGTTLTASGGSTYAWSTGATTAAITVSPAANTTYTVTATSAAGCTATASRTVTVNALPTAAVAGTNTICAGNSTTLTASGGSTYAWSTGATTAAITVSPAANTTYTVTATSAAGCTATASRTVTVNALPSAAISGTASVCAGNGTTLTASGGSTYAWSTGATTAAITVSPAANTTYTVTATSAAGCTATASRTVTVNALPTAAVAGTNTICAGNSTTLTASGGSTYAWSTGATTAAITVSPAANTTYTVTATSAAGCTATASRTVTVNALPSAAISGTASICAGNGTTLTASGGSTYAWSTGATTAAITVSPAANTTYTVTATSAAGCTATASRTVTVNALPSAAISGTASVCAGNGTTLTASGGSTYAWSTGATTAAITVSPAANTTYTVTATSAAGCTATASRTVTVNALPTAAVAGTNTICAGNSTTLTASGGSTYAWSTGATTAAITVSPAANTTYTVTATSAAGCTATASRTVTVNALPTAAVAGTNTICAGNGTTLTASGGSTYAWSTGATTAAITVSPAANTTYTVTATSAAGCTATASRTVTVNALPTAAVAGTNTICAGNSTTLTASGGSTYAWSTGATTAAITVSPAANTTYTVTATSAAGCTATASRTVTVSPIPTVEAGNNISSCTGMSAISMTGATAGGSYSANTWSGGAGLGNWAQNANPALATFTPTTASGSFTATLSLTGSGGCGNVSDTRTITWNSGIVGLTATLSANPICEGSDVNLSASVTSGVITSWSWSGPNSYSANTQNATVVGVIAPDNEGVYTVSATNSCGSTTATTTSLNVHSNVIGLTASYTSAICEGSDLALTASYVGSTIPSGDVTWSWSGPGGYSASVQNPVRTNIGLSGTGVYGVSATNACGVQTGSGPGLQVDANIIADADPNMLAAPGLDNGVIEACGTLVVTLQANDASPGTGQWSMVPNSLPNTGSVVSISPNNQSSNVTVTYSNTDPLPVSFRWTVTNGVCPPTESDVRVVFDPAINVTAQTQGCSFTSADSILVVVNATGGAGSLNFVAPTMGELRVDINASNKGFTVPMDGDVHNFAVNDGICQVAQTATVPFGHPTDLAFGAGAGSTVATCYQSQFNKWTTYSDDANNAILSINDNGQDLGQVNVTVYKDVAPSSIAQSADADNCQGYNSTAMQRHFMVAAQNTFSSPVGLRVYFTDTELQALITASQANDIPGDLCSQNDNIYDLNGLYLTKYTGANEDGDYSNNLPSGLYKVYGDATSLPTQPDGPMAKSSGGFGSIYAGAQGHHYAELSVSEFSELWLHGSQNGTALPVEMLFLEANAVNNSYIEVKWATILEINNNGFQVERSTDGQLWSTIGWVDGHGDATVRHDYKYDDNTAVAGMRYYYRLKQIDNDGAYEYTGVVSAIINASTTFAVKDFVPNPAVNATSIVIVSNNDQEIEMSLFNIIGEPVSITKHQLNKGSNLLSLEVDNIAAGTYTAIVSSANEVYSKKLVITK